jgi:hypothetical protein
VEGLCELNKGLVLKVDEQGQEIQEQAEELRNTLLP